MQAIDFLRSTVLAALTLGLAGTASFSHAEEERTVLILFDGSGSMWGNLEADRTNKFYAARDALRLLLPRIAPGTRLGLASYGHRRKGDCTDAEVMVRPAPGTLEQITTALNQLNPKGKGPLTLALKEAVGAIGPEARGSIVLVHDGLDNCQQDPCVLAAELQKSSPYLAVHVVSIAMEKEDVQRMSCVAQKTGGRHFDVRDAGTLTAAVEEALRLATLDKAIVAPRPQAAQRPGRKAPASQPDKAGSQLVAYLAPEIRAAEPVRWTVRKAGGGEEVVLETAASEIVDALAPGSYIVEVALGRAALRETVELGPAGSPPVRVVLNAGTLQLSARAYKEGDAATGVLFSVSTDDGNARAAPIWMSATPNSSIVLPAGSYLVRAVHGLARQERRVTVAAGNQTAVDFVLGTGTLELSAVADEQGTPLDRVIFLLAVDDPDAPQGRREIARSAAPQPTFVVPAGTYSVTARLGSAEVRQRIAVGAGDVVKRTIVLGLSNLSLTTAAERVPGSAAAVRYRVVRLDVPQREVAASTSANASFALPAGRYRIVAQFGAQNARIEREVELKAGRPAALALKPEAAEIALKLAEPATLSEWSDVFWEIRDASGRIVWRTSQAEPKALLAPGRYLVRAETRARRLERLIELKAGEQRVVELRSE